MRHAHVTAILPRLRRHALILAGDRAMADESVSRCLQSYRADPSRVRTERAALDLFRLFHDALAVPVALAEATAGRRTEATTPKGPEHEEPAGARRAAAVRLLGGLPPAQRRVLSLIAIEDFSVDDCAHVLSLPRSRVTALLADARRGLADAGWAATPTSAAAG